VVRHGLVRAVVEMKQRNPNWGCPRIAQQIALAFHSRQCCGPTGSWWSSHESFRHREHGNFGLFFTAALARIDLGGRRMIRAPSSLTITPSLRVSRTRSTCSTSHSGLRMPIECLSSKPRGEVASHRRGSQTAPGYNLCVHFAFHGAIRLVVRPRAGGKTSGRAMRRGPRRRANFPG
jgi:hypothetical protein